MSLERVVPPAKKRDALLIVDMQNDLVLPGGVATVKGALASVPQVAELLMWFRKRHGAVFHIVREYRQDGCDIEISRREAFLSGPSYLVPGTKGAEIVEALALVHGEHRIVKPRFSAFFGTELDLILRRWAISRIIVCGTQYPNCIRATAFDSLSYGYDTIVVTDATSASSSEIAESNIRDMRTVGIRCITLAEYRHEEQNAAANLTRESL